MYELIQNFNYSDFTNAGDTAKKSKRDTGEELLTVMVSAGETITIVEVFHSILNLYDIEFIPFLDSSSSSVLDVLQPSPVSNFTINFAETWKNSIFTNDNQEISKKSILG